MVLDALLRGTDASWHTADEGPGTWSAYDIVGHLIHGEETDWIPRARLILKQGDAVPFEPFDREAQFKRFRTQQLGDLLDQFAQRRRENVATVRAWDLRDEQLALPGLLPDLGPVTLQQLLATWTVHDLAHLAQIARVVSKGYADEVGPWRAYLSVLR